MFNAYAPPPCFPKDDNKLVDKEVVKGIAR